MDGEFADAREHAWIHLQHATNVIRRIHVRRIESRDHWVEPGLLLAGQRAIPARAERLGFTFRFTQLDAALAQLFP